MTLNILIPVAGSRTDERVFATAVQIARPLAAHLQLLHVQVSPGEAVRYTPHADFCRGSAVRAVVEEAQAYSRLLTREARSHFETLCSRGEVTLATTPGAGPGVTASWLEDEPGTEAVERLLSHARHHDLVAVGRQTHADFMPPDLLERLLLHCGRPLLIAADGPALPIGEHVVVAWKETPESARALGAALPILQHARQVSLLSIVEEGASSGAALAKLADALCWHGIHAMTHTVDLEQAAPEALPRALHRLKADLLVMGGFGRGALREALFGGVTRTVLQHADLPILMMH